MNNLLGDEDLKKLKRLKPNKFIFFLIFSLIFFLGELVFIYLKFIPMVLEPYIQIQPKIYAHLKWALEKIVVWFLVWPLMLFGVTSAMIYNAKVIQKFINRIVKEE